MIKINGVDPPAAPTFLKVTVLDLDDAEASKRTADGTMHRDRIAVKRKIDMGFGPLNWEQTSATLQLLKNKFVECTYPDPETGMFETKTFYSTDRETAFLVNRGSEIYWSGLRFSLIER